MKLKFLSRLALAAASCAVPAWAMRPPAGPRTETEVSYQILNRQSLLPPSFTVLFAPGGRKARVSFPGQAGQWFVDAAAGKIIMAAGSMRMEIPVPAAMAPYLDWRDSLAFSPGPHREMAGHDCQIWTTQTANGQGSVCLTADGVPLRIEAEGDNGSHTAVEALAMRHVAYRPEDFSLPARKPDSGVNWGALLGSP